MKYIFSKEYVEDENLANALRELGFRPPSVIIVAIPYNIKKPKFIICSSGIKKCYELVIEGKDIDLRDVSEKELEDIRISWEKEKKTILKLFKYNMLKDKIKNKIIEEIGESEWKKIESLTPTVVIRRR